MINKNQIRFKALEFSDVLNEDLYSSVIDLLNKSYIIENDYDIISCNHMSLDNVRSLYKCDCLPTTILTIWDDNKEVGVLVGNFADNDINIEDLEIFTPYRGLGYGTKALEILKSHKPVQSVFLSCDRGSVEFFRKNGFTQEEDILGIPSMKYVNLNN